MQRGIDALDLDHVGAQRLGAARELGAGLLGGEHEVVVGRGGAHAADELVVGRTVGDQADGARRRLVHPRRGRLLVDAGDGMASGRLVRAAKRDTDYEENRA